MQKLLHRLEALSRHHPLMLFSPRTYRYASTWSAYDRERIEAGMLPADDPRLRTAPRCHGSLTPSVMLHYARRYLPHFS